MMRDYGKPITYVYIVEEVLSMANLNVKKRLESISNDLLKVAEHVTNHSGIDRAQAMLIENMATDIVLQAVCIIAHARTAYGVKNAQKVIKAVRKALGFT